MDPLNKQERTEAFIKMLTLFLVAIIVVAIPLYQAFRLPSKESLVSSSECEKYKKQLTDFARFDQFFLNKTDTAKILYDQYEKEKDNVERDRMQLRFSDISNKMEDLANGVKSDSIKSLLFNNIVFSFNKLFSNKNEIYGLQEKLAKAEGKAGGGEEAEDTKTLLAKEIEIIKKSLSMHGGNKKSAARELGMSEKLYNNILKEYKLN
jgi:hypothetical protein